jgi:hypothetical protein
MPGPLAYKESRSPAQARAWFVPAGAADNCLTCQKKAAGKRYGFHAVRNQDGASELVHDEAALVCDQCARACHNPRCSCLLSAAAQVSSFSLHYPER